ncbi:hypothetical protein ACFCV8_07340 [Streptomyces sp. NPDC056347]
MSGAADRRRQPDGPPSRSSTPDDQAPVVNTPANDEHTKEK